MEGAASVFRRDSGIDVMPRVGNEQLAIAPYDKRCAKAIDIDPRTKR
jgi:hypothetical protein